MGTIGRYEVVRQLGHGGMGDVFLARDPSLERDVALKLLHRDDGRGGGLGDEARALAALRHPGIVTVYEIGLHEGREFIAMEYLPGRSLRDLLAEGATGRPALLAICAQVASGIAAAHRAGILHRDVKPENVVVDEDGGVKVVDFGIARRLHDEARRSPRAITASEVVEVFRRTLPPETGTDTIVSAGTQTVFGTPAYMAPEVLLGAPSTEASDVYSLGVMVHECVAGRRPYEGAALVEVLAQMIDGPPPRLDGPIGDLVTAMLASDPVARPTLDAIAKRLHAAAHPPAPALAPPVAAPAALAPPAAVVRRRWPLVVGGLIVLAGGAAVAWRVLDRPPPPPAAAIASQQAAPVVAQIAIAPLAITMPSYGAEPPDPAAVTDTLARMLGQVDGARLTGVTIAASADPRGAARAVGADYVVTGTIREQGERLIAELVITNVATGEVGGPLEAQALRGAQLTVAMTERLAHAIAPAARLATTPSRPRALAFYRTGQAVIETGHFTEARPYLEQAVEADPGFFDGWYMLALVLGWMNAPEDQLIRVTTQAIATATPGPKQELMRGAGAFLAGDYARARATLEPLVATAPHELAADLHYYLGETDWHDGRHAAAFAHFRAALEANPRFRPATVHSMQYTLAHRDAERARYFVGLAGEDSERVEFAIGNYAALAASGKTEYRRWAQIVLGQDRDAGAAPDGGGEPLEVAAFAIGRALEAGDVAGARATFAAAWQPIAADPRPTATTLYHVEALGEVVVAGGLGDEARTLVAWQRAHSLPQPARGYERLSILTAALVGDAALIIPVPATERTRRLGEAAAAELAGDRAQAVEILDALVEDPSATWDYPERAALLRNLTALHRKRPRAALCADTLRPAVFRTAFLALRRACRSR